MTKEEELANLYRLIDTLKEVIVSQTEIIRLMRNPPTIVPGKINFIGDHGEWK